MSSSILVLSSSARNRANSICSGVTGFARGPPSRPSRCALCQLCKVWLGRPKIAAVAAMLWPAPMSLTVSSLNSSVYRARFVFPKAPPHEQDYASRYGIHFPGSRSCFSSVKFPFNLSTFRINVCHIYELFYRPSLHLF
jgi:hypothetical protein